MFKITPLMHKSLKVYVCLLLILLSVPFCTASTRGYITGMEGDKYLSMNPESSAENKVHTQEKSSEVIVVLDPGHGGEDLGTYYGDLYEKNINLDISKRMGDILEKSGIKVVLTRESDVFVGLRERSDMANNIGATLFISVHNNRMPGNSGYKGTETLYTVPEKRDDGKMDGERLAALVQRELVKNLGTENNGIIYRPDLSVLHRTQMPAVIAEVGYVSNYSDRQKLLSSNFRQKAAEALSFAVQKALKEMGAVTDHDGKWFVNAK